MNFCEQLPEGILPPPSLATKLSESQKLLGIAYYLDTDTQAIAMTTPEELDSTGLDARLAVHLGIVELIEQERRKEQVANREAALRTGSPAALTPDWADSWNQNWSLTPERQALVLNKHPISLRFAAQSLMRTINTERMLGNSPRFKSDVSLLPFDTITQAQQPHSPRIVAAYLADAGYYGAIARRTPRDTPVHPLPADSLDYLAAYPIPDEPHEGELTMLGLVIRFKRREPQMAHIIDSQNIFPKIRRQLLKPEVKYFDTDAIDRLQSFFDTIQIFNPEEDTSLSSIRDNSVIRHDAKRKLLELAQLLANIRTTYRRSPIDPDRRIMPCIATEDAPRLIATYRVLTKLAAGPDGIMTFTPAMIDGPAYGRKSHTKPKKAPARGARPAATLIEAGPQPANPPTQPEDLWVVIRPAVEPPIEVPHDIASWPSIEDLAEELGVSEKQILEAFAATCREAPMFDVRMSAATLKEKPLRVFPSEQATAITTYLRSATPSQERPLRSG